MESIDNILGLARAHLESANLNLTTHKFKSLLRVKKHSIQIELHMISSKL